MNEKVAVLGAGSWGTALANLLAKKDYPVTMWSFEPEVTDTINNAHQNEKYMSGIPLHDGLKATSDVREAVRSASVVVSVTPAQHVRRVLQDAAGAMRNDVLIVNASKGIETGTLKTMAEVVEDMIPGQAGAHATFLSGPSFALEVARERPTAVAIASHHLPSAERAQQLFQSPYFRVYTNADVIGVELGGSLKNVIAIAAGMVN
ncbi:MAG TPA: NAD(P)-binding domain-containing protein, partial [Longimicrobiales bacterium]|nr:NAD(P)-binding domain-containing protein [Longimicrobiales bacterium]